MRKVKDAGLYLELGVYYYNLFLVVGSSEYFHKALMKQYKKDVGGDYINEFIESIHIDKEENKGGVYYSVDISPVKGGNCYSEGIIWLKEWNWVINDYCLLVHEILHHCIQVFDDVHIDINTGNDEPLCYYTSFVYKKVLEQLVKHESKK